MLLYAMLLSGGGGIMCLYASTFSKRSAVSLYNIYKPNFKMILNGESYK